MTICPIAVVVGCKKCPAFSVCPLKSVLGDQPKAEQPSSATSVATSIDAPKVEPK